jgi:hypothetical protein
MLWVGILRPIWVLDLSKHILAFPYRRCNGISLRSRSSCSRCARSSHRLSRITHMRSRSCTCMCVQGKFGLRIVILSPAACVSLRRPACNTKYGCGIGIRRRSFPRRGIFCAAAVSVPGDRHSMLCGFHGDASAGNACMFNRGVTISYWQTILRLSVFTLLIRWV